MILLKIILTIIISFILVITAVPTESNDQHQKKQQQGQIVGDSRPWTPIGLFDGQRIFHASVAIDNRIYIFGGFFVNTSGTTYYDDVQYFEVDVTTGLMVPNSLTFTSSFSTPRLELAATYYNGYIYLVGGYSIAGLLNDVEYGRVEHDGQVLQWTTSPSKLNFVRSQHELQVLKTSSGKAYLAAIAGGTDTPENIAAPTDTIEVAEIHSDGSIGDWKLCSFHLKGARQWITANIINNHLYVIGGRGILSDEIFDDIQFSSIQDDGCPGPWRTSLNELIMPLYGHKSVVLNGNALVVLGGNAGNDNYFNNIQYSTVPASGADTTSWIFDQYQFLHQRYGHSAVQVNGKYVYVLGGQTGPIEYTDDIQMSMFATFN